MKKKFSINFQKDEINLFELFKVIWAKKYRIIIITFISSAIGLFYYYQKSPLFEITLKINERPNLEFAKLIPIYKFIDSQEERIKKLNEDIVREFVAHTSNQKNFIKILHNSEKFKKNFTSLSGTYTKAELYSYAKFFNIEKDREIKRGYIFKLNWQSRDINNGQDILIDIMNESLLHFQKDFFKDLLNKLNAKKEYIIATDLDKINFLKEQYEIASELGLSSKDVNNTNYKISIDFDRFYYDPYSITLSPYFLLGQEVILSLINLVENRNYKRLNNHQDLINNLKDTNSITWIEYNPFLIDVKSENNFKNILLVSIILGLVIGVLQVLLFNFGIIKRK